MKIIKSGKRDPVIESEYLLLRRYQKIKNLSDNQMFLLVNLYGDKLRELAEKIVKEKEVKK